jgi:uncharacterized membrane protein
MAVLAVATALVPAFGVGPEGGDLRVFAGYGARIVHGAVPYRDVAIEYPPGSLAVIVPPAVGSPLLATYADRFEAGALAVFVLALILLAYLRLPFGLRLRTLIVVAAAPLLLGPVALKRFDILPALLTLAALALALRRRPVWAAALLGLGTAVKLYPIVLLPLVLAEAGRRGAARAAAAFAGACAVVFVPALAVSPHGVISSLHSQAGRHLQMETPLGSVALLAHRFAGMNIGLVSEAHTYGLGGTSGRILAGLTALAFLAMLAVLWTAGVRLVAQPDGLVLAWAAVVCTVVVLGQVLSPQYLIWLLPVAPLVAGRLGWAATALFVLALVLTNVWYPARYFDALLHDDGGSIVLLVARNAVLCVLLLTLGTAAVLRARSQSRPAQP